MIGFRVPSLQSLGILGRAALCAASILPTLAHANTFTVTRTDDPTPGACQSSDCSLREAVLAANARSGPDTIVLGARVYTLSIANVGGAELDATRGDLDIRDELVIQGAGAGSTVVDANNAATGDRAFEVNVPSGATVRMTGFTITRGALGYTGSSGAGILASTPLTLQNMKITNNGPFLGFKTRAGGGVAAEAALVVEGSEIAGNAAVDSGGGIFVEGASATIRTSYIHDNDVDQSGGGISFFGGTDLLVDASTIESNSVASEGPGGGLAFRSPTGQLTVSNSRVLNNFASLGGGMGIEGQAFITGTVVESNFSSGLWTEGEVRLEDCVVTRNTALNSGAGILAGGGQLTLLRTTISNNRVDGEFEALETTGGGISATNTMVLVTLSTVSGNAVGVDVSIPSLGGGIFVQGGSMDPLNSTISGNSSWGHGGGVYLRGASMIAQLSTLANNTADSDADGNGDGGGIFVETGTTPPVFFGTILADNVDRSGQAPDCAGTLNSLDDNLVESLAGCTLVGPQTGDITGQDPRLGPLANNGGPTQTHALLSGSPAIDHPFSRPCTDDDQRGVSRPQDGNNDGVALCDIGAFEKRPFEPGPGAFYFSLSDSDTLEGIEVKKQDIVFFDGQHFQMYFDGSDVGIGSLAIDAFAIIPEGIVMSFTSSASVPGISGTVDDSDLVLFKPTALGSNTRGTFSFYFDGSDIGLSNDSEDIDAIEIADGVLYFSTLGDFSIPGLSGKGQDVVACIGYTPGRDSRCASVQLFFDGSDVGLTESGENVDAFALASSTDLYLSVSTSFSVPGLSGPNEDVFVCVQPDVGPSTACQAFTRFFDGTPYSLDGNIAGIDLP